MRSSHLAWRIGFEADLLERVEAAVLAVDLDGIVLYANRYCETLYGRTPEELVGRNAVEYAVEPLEDAITSEIGATLTAGRTWEGDFCVSRADGTVIQVHAIDSPLFDDHGRLVGVVSFATDVTARRFGEAVLRFLVEAGSALEESFGHGQGLEHLARLSVPFLGDICVIDVLEDDHWVRAAAVHADPAKEHLVRALALHPPDPTTANPAARVASTGRGEYRDELTDELLRGMASGPEHLELIRALEPTSYVSAPMRARGRTLGSFTVISAGSGRRFGPRDLEIVEDTARRAAVAIDNARLFVERDHVARALQASLLPPSLPVGRGIEFAAAYLAAGEGNEVGGDFYDVFELAADTWVVMIGDVSGSGPEAAAVTGRARHALRGAALRERRPGELLRTLNTALLREPDPHFCTVALGLIHRRRGRWVATFACGGHPPPYLVRPHGVVETIHCEGTALGILPDIKVHEETRKLARGHLVCWYTDGVIEARRPHGELFGEQRLERLLSECATLEPGALVTRVLDEVRGWIRGDPPDDVAIVVARIDGQHRRR